MAENQPKKETPPAETPVAEYQPKLRLLVSPFVQNRDWLFDYYEELPLVSRMAFDKCYRPARYFAIVREQDKFAKIPTLFLKQVEACYGHLERNEAAEATKDEAQLLMIEQRHISMFQIAAMYAFTVCPVSLVLHSFKKISKPVAGIGLFSGLAAVLVPLIYNLGVVKKYEKVMVQRYAMPLHQYEKYEEKRDAAAESAANEPKI